MDGYLAIHAANNECLDHFCIGIKKEIIIIIIIIVIIIIIIGITIKKNSYHLIKTKYKRTKKISFISPKIWRSISVFMH